MPSPASGNPGQITDRSGTITLGATAQELMAANSQRRGYWVQNLSAGDLYISSIGTAVATQPSLRIPSGALYEAPSSNVPTDAVSIYGATTSQAFSAREW